MHIPEGFLDIKTLIITDSSAGFFLFLATRRVQKNLNSESVSKMGIATALIFAFNILAFPVTGGTSAHLTGVFLISALLGGWEGFICSSCSLFLQALIFQHGGILTLGANILNIGGWGSLLGYLWRRIKNPPLMLGGVLAFLSIMLGSTSCVFELYISGRGSFLKGLYAMSIANFFPALIDGILSFFVLKFFRKKEVDIEAQPS